MGTLFQSVWKCDDLKTHQTCYGKVVRYQYGFGHVFVFSVSEEAATDECPYAEIRPSAKYADTIEGKKHSNPRK